MSEPIKVYIEKDNEKSIRRLSEEQISEAIRDGYTIKDIKTLTAEEKYSALVDCIKRKKQMINDFYYHGYDVEQTLHQFTYLLDLIESMAE